ncbi:Blue copper protein [Rhynchospora pubera]|uniref:Blue copper protein n=1 Tax=Rhynchospora pubera TaxID=906938 RepID=A0AAV8EHH4_9POAL|nr:Blue copper protein [Rhynchospora pubera]
MGYTYTTALCVLLFVAAAEAKEYVVGGSEGWSTGVDYGTWASSYIFNVGDTLVFQYGALHTVSEVSESDYSACSASNAIQSFGDQNTRITLTAPGTRYFICGSAGHCSEGMKLACTVSPTASTTPGSSSTPVTPGAGSFTPFAPGGGGSFTPFAPGGGGSFTPFAPGGGGSFTPGGATTPYQPYSRPFYYNGGVHTRSGFCGLVFAVFVVSTLLMV